MDLARFPEVEITRGTRLAAGFLGWPVRIELSVRRCTARTQPVRRRRSPSIWTGWQFNSSD